jgi:hypothetical protein
MPEEWLNGGYTDQATPVTFGKRGHRWRRALITCKNELT